MYEEIEEINEMAERLRDKASNLEMQFNLKLWDFLKGQISIYDKHSTMGLSSVVTGVDDDGINIEVSTENILADYLNNGVEFIIKDEFGNELEPEMDVDGSTVTFKVDTTMTIEDAVEQRVKKIRENEYSDAMEALAEELGVKNFDEAKRKLAKLKLIEKLITTPID